VPRIVDQNVDAICKLVQFLYQGSYLLSISQIARVNVGSTSFGLDTPSDLNQFLFGARHEEQVRSRLGQTLCQAFTNAVTRSGDEHCLAGQLVLEFGTIKPEKWEKE
jgi:hypothetical protein